MKSIISKYFFILLVIGVLVFIPSESIYAAAPHINGHVYKKGTDQPLEKSVWVQWTDGRGSIRYTQTAPDGSFRFESWQIMEQASEIQAECATQIDSNLDGTNESKKAYTVPKRTGEDNSYNGECHGHAWGCGENNHTWTAVVPSSMKGKFTFVEIEIPEGVWIDDQYIVDLINNEAFEIDIGIFYWEDVATPTPTSTPTSTPTATLTPAPTSSPTPRATNTPTPQATNTPAPTSAPTPTLVPCQCNKIEYTGTFGQGNTVTFTTTATVENPDYYHTTMVLDVDYYLYQTDSSETTTTGPVKVPAVFKETLTVNVIPVDYYTASWDYTFPTGLSDIVYFKVIAEIHCGYRSAGITYPQTSSVMVLAASTNTAENSGILSSILNFFQTLLGRNPTLRPQSVPPPAPTATPTPLLTVTPTINRSLQLATFGPWGLTSQSCTGLEFWINYDWQ